MLELKDFIYNNMLVEMATAEVPEDLIENGREPTNKEKSSYLEFIFNENIAENTHIYEEEYERILKNGDLTELKDLSKELKYVYHILELIELTNNCSYNLNGVIARIIYLEKETNDKINRLEWKAKYQSPMELISNEDIIVNP